MLRTISCTASVESTASCPAGTVAMLPMTLHPCSATEAEAGCALIAATVVGAAPASIAACSEEALPVAISNTLQPTSAVSASCPRIRIFATGAAAGCSPLRARFLAGPAPPRAPPPFSPPSSSGSCSMASASRRTMFTAGAAGGTGARQTAHARSRCSHGCTQPKQNEWPQIKVTGSRSLARHTPQLSASLMARSRARKIAAGRVAAKGCCPITRRGDGGWSNQARRGGRGVQSRACSARKSAFSAPGQPAGESVVRRRRDGGNQHRSSASCVVMYGFR
jgi:hypothetical protein